MLTENRIYRADIFDVLPDLADESVDCIVCDGPYGVTDKPWDRVGSVQQFNLNLIQQFAPKLKAGGVLYLFGKHDCIDFIDYRPYLKLGRRIIWYQPASLAQGKTTFTNNYDVICYFVKGEVARVFDLEAIRVPQLVELTQRRRCEAVPSVKNGKFAGTKFNERGKNPGDVWGDIKQLTYKSRELASREVLRTIQKPEKLMARLIGASTREGDLVLDPFAGTGTCPVVCKRLGRRFIGVERDPDMVAIAEARLARDKGGMPRVEADKASATAIIA